MALDNAQFISQLSITDPPGTDAVAEGDDHIRTTKRATQQSFPNVDAAVPQTAAQMGQMAIKNEVNSFTQANSFDGIVTLNDVGLHLNSITDALTPIHFRRQSVDRWRWQMENDAGGNDMGLLRFVGGVFQDSPIVFKNANGFINFNTVAAAFFGQSLRLETAAVASTSVQTGMLFIGGSGTLRWSLSRQADDVTGDLVINRSDSGGTFQDTAFRIRQSTGETEFTNSAFFRDGSSSNPSVAFTTQTGTGMYRPGTSLGFTVNGSDAAFLLPAQFRMILNGSQAAPTYSWQGFTNTGMFVTTGPVLQWATSGVSRMFIRANGTVNMQAVPTSTAGLLKGDIWQSAGDLRIIP